jgi:DNA-binding transcriptional MerR regulator
MSYILASGEGRVLVIPDKKYFRIGEVSRLVGLEPHVIRYWETEFTQLQPQRIGSKQRLYTGADIRLLETIRGLLHDKKYTIAGAKQELEQKRPEEAGQKLEPPSPPPAPEPHEPEHLPLFPSLAGQERRLISRIKEEIGQIIRVLS